jgi:small subunit ribosomal protein S10e
MRLSTTDQGRLLPRGGGFARTSKELQCAMPTVWPPEKRTMRSTVFISTSSITCCYYFSSQDAPQHPKLDVPNLEVIKLMQSFKSKEYVRETFSWQHYYWYLTNDGVEHLRTFLNLPSEVVPNTLKKSNKPPSRPFGSGPPGDRPR